VKDTLTVGVVAGIVGTIVMLILSQLLMALDLIKMATLDYSAEIFLEPQQAGTPAGVIVGLIAHFMVGAGGGVLLAYFMKISGKDYYWLKGLGLGAVMLLLGMAFVVTLMNIMPEMREDSLTVLFHMVIYFIYGLTCAYVIKRYGKFEMVES
jgi:hypothetical protein